MAVERLLDEAVKECRLSSELLVTREVDWVHLNLFLLYLYEACKPKNTNGDLGTSWPLVNEKPEQK